MRKSATRRVGVGVLVCLALGSAMAADGALASGGSSSFSSAEVAAAKAAGSKAGKAMGKRVPVHSETIGILQIAYSSESAAAAQMAIQAAAKQIGWKTIACDGEGNPVKIADCGNTLVSDNVNAIVSIANTPSTWAAPLAKAHAHGIPVINISGEIAPSPDIAASYAPSNTKQGQILAAWMVKKLRPLQGQIDISVNTFPALWGTARTNAVLAAAKTDPHIKVSYEASTDPTSVQAGTHQTITDQLTANPNLKAIWFSYDVAAQAGGQAVVSKFGSKQFPSRPLVLTFGTDSGTLALLRTGAISASVENDTSVNGYEAIDQLAEHFSRGAKIAPTTSAFTTYGSFPLEAYRLFTKANVTATGPVLPPGDFAAFFAAKWSAEFSGR